MFSLILCTINRYDDVDFFLNSLIGNKTEFEVIIVDQNNDGLIDDLILKYSFLNIKHLKTNIRGLSRARNYGKKYASGKFICFPDDDCIYSNRLIDKVFDIFQKKSSIDFLSIKTIDPKDARKSLVYCDSNEHLISFDKKAGCSFTYFFKRNKKFDEIHFDERMGVGANTKYGAGEETDYITQLLHINHKGLYYPDLIVYHKAKENYFDKETLIRLQAYGGGYAFYIKKNYRIIGFYRAAKLCLAPFKRLVISAFNKGEFLKSFYFLKGCFYGWFK
ncbi:glycosyltransferase family 2 protein [Superficieibacter sp. HKU1]|uniref:glycosyltransferase family 2 protein n=1 Tax=Superficieibacter sp. HKU1 TaxID=3031919 RepID=UPI0023E19BC5|nr:glycosyltransferase family 2 protein [Superficieibacter sp. HKU1]WES66719.1 glycosyltransferase family 2 protein [Superficieibacter sp. HKU1]